MGSFGENLRREREARRITLEQIATTTKIGVRLLQAIESEEFDRLPGGVFNYNFVRQYARHLGLDEEAVVDEFRRLTVPPADATPQRTVTPSGGPERSAAAGSEYGSNARQESRQWIMTALVLGALVVVSAVYMWAPERKSAPPSAQVESPAPPVSAPAPAPPETPPVEAKTPAVQKPAPAPVNSGDPNAPVRVELSATDRVWVSTIADGQQNFQGILEPSETRVITAQSKVRLRVGNAAGLNVTLNGQAQPPIGPKGHVRTVMLTREGMEIVTPPPEEEDIPPRAEKGTR